MPGSDDAALMHARARKNLGFAEAGSESLDDLISEKYRGIRPAFGYPACPDHTAKRTLFELLDAEALGMELTESCAIAPAASVSGIYFGHPDAKYFNVGRVDVDQISAYAKHQGRPQREVEKWLQPNLAYDPEENAS